MHAATIHHCLHYREFLRAYDFVNNTPLSASESVLLSDSSRLSIQHCQSVYRIVFNPRHRTTKTCGSQLFCFAVSPQFCNSGWPL